MSLVSWPCRYSAASEPQTRSLPRAERSSRPHSSRSCLYWASSSTVVASLIELILESRSGRPQGFCLLDVSKSFLDMSKPLSRSNSTSEPVSRRTEAIEDYAKAIYALARDRQGLV